MSTRQGAYFPFGFPLSRRSRETLRIAEILASQESREEPAEVFSLRALGERMNAGRLGGKGGPQAVRAGQLLAFDLLTDVLRYVMDRYCFEDFPGVLERGIAQVRERCADALPDRGLERFVHLYPPEILLEEAQTVPDFLDGATRGRHHRQLAAREVVLLLLSMANRALIPFQELFHDDELRKETNYHRVVECLNSFFNKEPALAPLDRTLFELLYSPMTACPDSVEGQLEWILENWRAILPEHLLRRLLLTRDILQEEIRGRGPVGGAIEVLRFGLPGGYPEYDRFSRDRDWMPNLVLVAKAVHVWMHQLSRKYGREIRSLDQIPDEELDLLARWGFNGLWLIGLWERSPASRRIKQLMGNPEALSSAYSLYDYEIAADLGGEDSYQNLRRRASARGIRLASDMVPNHVGVYSRWVIQHPDWFIQLDHPPYPDYHFTGENLSHDARVGIRIEDGYWRHTNAAVVFQRVDHWTGSVRYIYHGNDGTHMPWNDTAQLNYLNGEVREAVIQTILHVARRFPIIRFDAAMTLAKKHYQRLWFPPPGHGGAIPSRSEHGMTREEFDARMPEEFWREVVDRVAAEVPDTLLVAEAFWLMEGYFVRTLGMHRVYNSAFMNMLKMEENANYRLTVRNVLEYSPGILQRFVNFMNNPDERTAVEQFGKGDKYFGVAVLMVTMPGLPMFGHGQIEGFTEKYGMEYSRSYWDEPVDEGLVRRHEAEIFPLMRRRYLFSGVENFAFYDFVAPEGHVNEDVFAYSNRAGDERALIVYNNRHNSTCGWVRRSTAINLGTPQETHFVHKTLAEALGISSDERTYYLFRDHATGLEYIRAGRKLAAEGLYIELRAYQYQAFLDFREVYDADGSWARTESDLDGKGVPSVDRLHKEIVLEPVLTPFRSLLKLDLLRSLVSREPDAEPLNRFGENLERLLASTSKHGLPSADPSDFTRPVIRDLRIVAALTSPKGTGDTDEDRLAGIRKSAAGFKENPARWRDFLAVWSVLRALEPVFAPSESDRVGSRWMEDWLLSPTVQETLKVAAGDDYTGWFQTQILKTLLAHPALLTPSDTADTRASWRKVLNDPAAQECLQVNAHGGTVWFNRERFESLLDAAAMTAAVDAIGSPAAPGASHAQTVAELVTRAAELLTAAEKSGYRAETFLGKMGKMGTEPLF